MQILPAIDLLNSRCVRLQQGQYESATVYSEDPVALATTFLEAGVQALHVVDLDGARSGRCVNIPLLRQLSETGLRVDFGGGLQDTTACEAALEAGAAQLTVGSIVVLEPARFEQWCNLFGPHRFIAALDVQDGEIRVKGWQAGSGQKIADVLPRLLALGVRDILCTEISRDGMLTGPAFKLYEELLSSYPSMRLWASGGVASLSDLERLRESGLARAVVGRALYEGRITLQEVVRFNQQMKSGLLPC